jgi:hypothetical protein
MTPKAFGITTLQNLATLSRHLTKDEAATKLRQQVHGRRGNPNARCKDAWLQNDDVKQVKSRSVPKKSPGSQSSSSSTPAKRPRSKSTIDSDMDDSDKEGEPLPKRTRLETPGTDTSSVTAPEETGRKSPVCHSERNCELTCLYVDTSGQPVRKHDCPCCTCPL